MITNLQVYIRAKPVTLIDFIVALPQFCVYVCVLRKNEHYIFCDITDLTHGNALKDGASRLALLFHFRRTTLDDYRNNVEREREC